ncbi:MAG: recombinase RecT [Immundisolibacteraceae bacterium]|nr:recombinase RecT [Immundisolibacteraceae bacterium]
MELATVQNELSGALMAAGVDAMLPSGTTIDQFIRCASIAMVQSKDLCEANQDSVIMALTMCARDGLVPDNKEAALVTFNTKDKTTYTWVKKAQYLPMIDGVIKRARMSGQIASMASKAVYENDAFDYWMDENGEHYNYRPTFGDRGNLLLCFSYAKLTNGELLIEVMTKADIDKVKAASKTSGFGPWVDWYDRMGCKAVTHRLCRRLPNASEMVQMCEQGMNMAFDPNTEKDITPPPVENYGDKLISLFAGKPQDKYLPWLSKKLGHEVLSLEDVTAEESVKVIEHMESAKS